MTEVIGTAASIVGLIGTAFTLVQQVRNARNQVKGASTTLDNVSKQLEGVERSLALVEDEEGLHTAGVEQQVRAITEFVGELRSFFQKLATEQRKRAVSQFFHALKSGDKDDKELQSILDRLDRARDELVLRITVAQVGVVGNLGEGFRVAFDVLMDTNKKVNKVLGTNLVLAERLKDRSLQQTADGTVRLDPSDVERLRLADSERESTSSAVATDSDETSIYGNITVGQARIMTGHVGVENWQKVAGRKTTIARNKFGQDVRIMTGDQGGEAAARFNESFWN